MNLKNEMIVMGISMILLSPFPQGGLVVGGFVLFRSLFIIDEDSKEVEDNAKTKRK